MELAPDLTELIRTARGVNDNKPLYIVERIRKAVAGVKDPTITCLGLSFKADVDDLRKSPALQIIERLAHENVGKILVVEPHIDELTLELTNQTGIELTGLDEGLEKADMVVLLVDHQAFGDIPPEARTDQSRHRYPGHLGVS